MLMVAAIGDGEDGCARWDYKLACEGGSRRPP